MDSLTQIVLGAAVGEACLGRKLGNRAMVWGAVGGTIPDLDVLSNLFLNELDATVFHRSLTHSLPFAVLFPFVTALLARWIYEKGWYKYRRTRIIFYLLSLTMIGSVVFGINAIAHQYYGQVSWILLGLSLIVLIWFGWRWLLRYVQQGDDIILPAFGEWYNMFFWAFLTHALLDCMTAYGTQLFFPFDDYRVAINNIAVVDPLYTIPFLLLLVIAGAYYRKDPWRKYINWAAIGVSSLYLVFTLFNHARVKQTFRDSLRKENIDYDRLIVTPTIFNNALWNGVAQKEDTYYYARYSIFDREQAVSYFKKIDGKHELLSDKEDYDAYQKLRWFSNGYFSLVDRDSFVQYNDLRYGLFNDEAEEEDTFIFFFKLIEKDGDFEAISTRSSEREEMDMSDAMKKLWERIKGK